MIRLTILRKPDFTQMEHARHQLKSRLPRMMDAKPISNPTNFYFELDVDLETGEELKAEMEKLGNQVVLEEF